MYSCPINAFIKSDKNKSIDHVQKLKAHAEANGAEVIKICAKIEEEMTGMSEEERNEFLTSLGTTEGSGLEQIIKKGYKALGLISYFTAGPKEVRAWTIENGWKAPKSASVIHNDFERGFIRAEVVAYADFVSYKGEAGARSAGKLRTEGKEYTVVDGDVMISLYCLRRRIIHDMTVALLRQTASIKHRLVRWKLRQM